MSKNSFALQIKAFRDQTEAKAKDLIAATVQDLLEIAQNAAKEAAKLEKLADDCTIAEKLIARFEGVHCGEKLATKQDARWLLNLQMANPLDRGRGRSFVEQVLAFSGSRANYLGKSGAVSSEPLSKSAGKRNPRRMAKNARRSPNRGRPELPDFREIERRDLLHALALLRWAQPLPMGAGLSCHGPRSRPLGKRPTASRPLGNMRQSRK